jgi:hypothetical protein
LIDARRTRSRDHRTEEYTVANDTSTIAYVARRIADYFEADEENRVTEAETSDSSHCLDITVDGETVRVTIS